MIKFLRLLLLKQKEAGINADIGVTVEALQRGRVYLDQLEKVHDKKVDELRKVRARISLLEDTRALVDEICNRGAAR